MSEGLLLQQMKIHCGGTGYLMISSCLIRQVLRTVRFSVVNLHTHLVVPMNTLPQALFIRLQRN
ncbi:hypothetical protein E1A91_D03G027400v1 [Gossypium mustelinum]|uniref:Uncharacterized protein n=2 Tax=Gossypium TaxID=3633 RepID=A0A5J5S6X2_GOSBA|nr:hypothetical protein ES319_D03G027000v1 [Gossypium barbadense]TYI89055.1 hypothetical protein E1A91_D03G027400v1 [Gossypium mustelinum]